MALDVVDRVLADKLEIGLELDALGNHLGAETVAELGESAEDAARLLPVARLLDDLEIDLDLGHRQIGELQEAAVALADVVEREAKAGQAELGEDGERLGRIVVQAVLD